MRWILSIAYGALAYLAFLLPIGYLVGFLADVGVPKTVDRGAGPLGPSLAVDVALLVGFGLQHSVMARPWFKEALQGWVPEGLERSTYVLISGLTLSAVFWLWRPIPLVMWEVSGTPLGALAWTGFGAGWVLAVWSTFALSHFHLFGVTQARAYARELEHPRLKLREPRLYRIVRHPMTAGLLLAFWSAPRMTLGHAIFAAGMTVYSLWATVLEERDLLRTFPDGYRKYRMEVPALLPLLRPGRVVPRRGGLALELSLVALLAALPFVRLAGASLKPPAPGETEPTVEAHRLSVADRERTFALFDPRHGAAGGVASGAALPTANPRPLVLALHGTDGGASRLRGFLGGDLERVAASRGWLVAYPEAVGGVWNECRRRAGSRPRSMGVDDVAFLRALVERLVRERRADPSRVFAMGYSGGGHMAFRLAMEAPSLVAGVAVFGASPPVEEASVCEPAPGAVAVMIVNGTDDPVNPFVGGDAIAPTGTPLGPVMGSEEGARFFDALAGGRAEVRLVRIEGGGHVVPGPASRFPTVVGRSVSSFAGIDEALAFFGRQAGASGRLRTPTDREAS